jgi:hypothetical protein
MAAGAGAWIVAVTITAIAIVSLWPLRLVADRLIGRDPHTVRVRLIVDDPRALAQVLDVIGENGGTVTRLGTTVETAGRMTAEVSFRARDLATGTTIATAVASTAGVQVGETSSVDD